MERKICVDSDLLIDFLRGEPDAVRFIIAHKNLSTTQINLFELYHGAYKSAQREQNVAAVDQLAQQLIILPLTNEVTKRAGQLSAELSAKGNTIDFRDLFIGMIARANGYAVKTNNRKDFERISELRLI